MARLYAYKCIQAEERKLQEQFENLPINGRKTTRQTIKRIKELKLDASYRLAQKCNVMVSWHKMSIQGQRVVLGEASIILPDCGQQVIWIKTVAGKNMPCNPQLVTYRQGNGKEKIVTPNGEVLSGELVGAGTQDATGVGYISHFATCPNATSHRKK